MAMNKMPYFAKLLLSLKPIPCPGLGTFGVDAFWRMYYDPKCVEEWTIEEICAVWLHEIGHIYRDHANRFEINGAENAKAWNIAADAAINSDLKEIDSLLPHPEERYYTHSEIFEGAKKGSSTEFLYNRIKRKIIVNKKEIDENVIFLPNNDERKQNDDEEKEVNIVDVQSEQDSKSDDVYSTDEQLSEPNNDRQSDGSGDTESESSSEDSGNADENSQPSDQGLNDNGELSQAPSCGSAVDNQPRDYEIPYDDDENPGISPQEAAKVVLDTAQEVEMYEKSRPGSVPGGIIRETTELLNPIVDWKNSLKVRVRREIGIGMAKTRNSYKKISRRGAAIGKGIILPGRSGDQEIIIYIVLDTSGSMTKKELTLGVSEIFGLLKKVRGKMYFISVDARASEPMLVTDINDLVLEGGGGTDMGVGINAAAQSIPKPDIILTITDGGTPWINKPPKEAPKAKYIAVIIVPRKKYQGHGVQPSEVTEVPKFIETIVAYV